MHKLIEYKRCLPILLSIFALVFLSSELVNAGQSELRGWGPMKGVAQRPDGTPYVFAHIDWAMNNDFPITMDRAMKTLMKRAGGKVITLDPDNNLEKQIAMFEDAAQRGVDAIIFSPVDSEGVTPTINRLSSRVPFFNVDHRAASDKIVNFATHDQVDCGRVGARYLVEWAKKHNKKLIVYEVWGKTGHEGSERRHQGFHEIFNQYPELITVIESPATEWMTDRAMQFVVEALSAHPEINAICSHNNMIPGVVEALRNLKRLYPIDHPKHIPYVGIDCFPVSMQHLRDGYCDGIAVHSPWEEMDAAVTAALLHVCCGREVPKVTNFNSFLLTQENIENVRFGAPYVWGDMWNKVPDFDKWPKLEYPDKYNLPVPTRDMKKAGF